MFDSLFCTGEGSKGSGSPLGLQGRLAQLEERLVCNQKAGGSNPPASTLPLFVESFHHIGTWPLWGLADESGEIWGWLISRFNGVLQLGHFSPRIELEILIFDIINLLKLHATFGQENEVLAMGDASLNEINWDESHFPFGQRLANV